jgi:hypothetical protein
MQVQSSSLRRPLLAGLVGAAVLGLAACSNDNETPPLAGGFRIANGITDTDANGLDGKVLEAFQFNGIDFGAGSDIKFPPQGSYTAHMDINAQEFSVEQVGIHHDEVATVFTYGSVAGATVEGFAASVSLNAPASTQFVVQPLHSAYAASLAVPTLSYYFVAAGSADFSGTTPIMVPFATQMASSTLPSGNYRIVVTNGSTVVYDSGMGASGVTLPPPGSNVLQIAALDAPGAPNGSTLSLLLLDNANGSTLLLNGAH